MPKFPFSFPNSTNTLPEWVIRHENWTLAGSYVLPLLVMSWAPSAGVDDFVISLTALFVAAIHWLWRPLAATLFGLFIGHSIWLANAEKLRDSGSGILWQDIVYALPNLHGNVGTLLQYVGLGGLAIGLILIVSIVILLKLERAFLGKSTKWGLLFSGFLGFLFLPSAMGYYADFRDDFTVVHRHAMSFSGRVHASSLARFAHSIAIDDTDIRWTGHAPEEFRNLASALPNEGRSTSNANRPDIFVVLLESQFSPVQFSECQDVAACRMSIFEPDPHSLMRGPLRVHTLGWGTWNAEFAIMSGTPHIWYGGNGLYSAYTIAPRIRQGLPAYLSSLGYHTIAIYPTQKGMLNAVAAYRQYGIQEFHGAEDLELSLDWCQIPDSLMYAKLDELYKSARARDDRPIFMMMLTVFNHGPHGDKCASQSFNKSIRPDRPLAALKFGDYLDRSRQTDLAAMQFLATRLRSDRHTLILFAGDHQPSFEGGYGAYPRKMHRNMPKDEEYFFTNYHFLANYSLPTGTIPAHSELDISFISGKLLTLSQLPLNGSFLANVQLSELCHGRLDTCPGKDVLQSYRAHLAETGFFK